jgi:hypothetical protein
LQSSIVSVEDDINWIID